MILNIVAVEAPARQSVINHVFIMMVLVLVIPELSLNIRDRT